MVTITGFETRGTQLPVSQLRIFSRLSLMNNTRPSLDKTGSDAMNAAGHYSAAYCILKTVSEHSGHGMVRNPAPPEKRYSNWSHHIKTFTIGRGNDIVCSAITYLAARIKGSTLASLVKD